MNDKSSQTHARKMAPTNDGSRSNIFDPGRIGSGQVSYLWFVVGFEKFPLKIPNFSIFPFRSKKYLLVGSKVTVSKTGQPLFYCRLKVCLAESSPIRAHL